MKSYTFLCITGTDGSGKSTLIGKLKSELPNCSTITIWDLLTNTSGDSLSVFKTPADVDRYLSTLCHNSRSLFLMHCLSQAFAIAKVKNPDYIISDGYWYKYYATEVVHGTPASYLDCLVSIFETPDRVYSLIADPSITAKRKDHYSRYECGFSKDQNELTFIGFQSKAATELKKLLNGIEHIPLNADLEPELNKALILDSLKTSVQ